MNNSEVEKMLRAIANTQSVMRKEMHEEFKKSRQDNTKEHELINKRIDLLGSDLAYLEDDAPTREEYDELEKRVKNIEKKLSAN